MKDATTSPTHVLAVHPTTSGFGWTLFEVPCPRSTGASSQSRTRKKTRTRSVLTASKNCSTNFSRLLSSSNNLRGSPSRRVPRVRSLCRAFGRLADTRGGDVYVYSRAEIASVFKRFGATTRQQIATTVAAHIDAFEHLLPPARRSWDPKIRVSASFRLRRSQLPTSRSWKARPLKRERSVPVYGSQLCATATL